MEKNNIYKYMKIFNYTQHPGWELFEVYLRQIFNYKSNTNLDEIIL